MIEIRIALLHLDAADADAEISDDEFEAMMYTLGALFARLGVHQSADVALSQACRRLDDAALIRDSIQHLGTLLPRPALEAIIVSIAASISVDELAPEEQQVLHQLTGAWLGGHFPTLHDRAASWAEALSLRIPQPVLYKDLSCELAQDVPDSELR